MGRELSDYPDFSAFDDSELDEYTNDSDGVVDNGDPRNPPEVRSDSIIAIPDDPPFIVPENPKIG